MKYAGKMNSGAKIKISSFVKTGSGVQKYTVRGVGVAQSA
jgi:hypothetical protein